MPGAPFRPVDSGDYPIWTNAGSPRIALTTLFDAAGSEIYLKPAENYVRVGEWVNFATVIEAARRRGETAVGFRLLGQSQEPPSYGVRLNPAKHDPLVLDPGDRIIVLAED